MAGTGDKTPDFFHSRLKPGADAHGENGKIALETITEASFPGKRKVL